MNKTGAPPRAVIPIHPVAPDAAAAPAAGADGDEQAVMVSLYEKQRHIYPRAVSGRFMAWRWVLVWATQLLFYGLPWLTWNDRPAVLFDLGLRRFFIGPLVLYPQDFIFLTGLLILSAASLFLFTAVAGRLWCGYACPQTVYTELFMWVERRLEGDRIARMRLDQSPWNWNKLWRKTSKQSLWIAMGLWTGFTFVGYFTPIRTLAAEALTLSFGPWEWFWVLFYGFATYGNAGWMREQVCKYMCPYARFQGAMFDRDTLIIGYDEHRGEARGSRSRKADPRALGLGDCIDCGLCVQVCPTGIDIRKGLQYECIGCAACIDVCDGVMDKMAYPRGLIRYDTQNGLARQGAARSTRWQQLLRPRVLVYGGVLLAGTVALLAGLALRAPVKVDVVRDRATLARFVDEGRVENIYRLQMMNATERPQQYRISVEGLASLGVARQPVLQLDGAQARWFTVALQLPHDAARQAGPGAHPIRFHIVALSADGHAAAAVVEKSTFIVPR